jgi:hypothetical protein
MLFHPSTKDDTESSRKESRPATFRTQYVFQRIGEARTRSLGLYVCTRQKVWLTRNTSTRRLTEVKAAETRRKLSSVAVSTLFDLRSSNDVWFCLISGISQIEFHCQLTSSAQTLSMLCTTPRLGPRIVSSRDDVIREIGRL